MLWSYYLIIEAPEERISSSHSSGFVHSLRFLPVHRWQRKCTKSILVKYVVCWCFTLCTSFTIYSVELSLQVSVITQDYYAKGLWHGIPKTQLIMLSYKPVPKTSGLLILVCSSDIILSIERTYCLFYACFLSP